MIAAAVARYFRRKRLRLTMPRSHSARALQISCPICGAGVQAPCRRETGEPMDDLHIARVRAWEKS